MDILADHHIHASPTVQPSESEGAGAIQLFTQRSILAFQEIAVKFNSSLTVLFDWLDMTIFWHPLDVNTLWPQELIIKEKVLRVEVVKDLWEALRIIRSFDTWQLGHSADDL